MYYTLDRRALMQMGDTFYKYRQHHMPWEAGRAQPGRFGGLCSSTVLIDTAVTRSAGSQIWAKTFLQGCTSGARARSDLPQVCTTDAVLSVEGALTLQAYTVTFLLWFLPLLFLYDPCFSLAPRSAQHSHVVVSMRTRVRPGPARRNIA